MTKREILYNEIEEIPESLLDNVIDYISSLKLKMSQGKLDTAILSESSLAKDWLKPEEDEAWKDL